MENNIVLVPVPLADLLRELREIVRQEIAAGQTEGTTEKLLSVKEACKMFQPAISPQTLHTWTKDGLIPMQKIGGKNYYKLSDVLSAGTVLKRYKHST
jgi:hypothetical protein